MSADNLATVGSEEKNSKVNLEAFAKMTGFPIDLIKDEVFNGQKNENEVSLEELRSAMLSFIDATMLDSKTK